MKYGRKILRDVEGYVPGEQPQIPDIVKLNTNENPYPPSPKVIGALRSISPEALRRYPDPLSTALRSAFATCYGMPGLDWVICGNGADELLALAMRSFVDPGDTVLTTYPTYTLYETLALLHGAEIRMVHLDGRFGMPDAFFSTPARLCIVARPNAPSGVAAPRADIERLCQAFDGLVVIDEAYADFADDNCLDFPQRFENAIVMRTFSKSFSLAGLRLGVAFARPEIIAEFLKTKDSYNLNAIAQAVALAALEDVDYAKTNVAKVRATRARLTEALRTLGFDVPDSQANFVLARWDGTPDAKAVFAALRQRAIIVRYFDAPRLSNALRISVGTDHEVDRLLAALRDILG
ncbi:MAG TPA: histidinol-phosphate transaminase [Candidatus Hydrogenedentes bacterium]|nr:histidinol-phosphate transaminase [Candidatus Hydrogenedentota bacterium]HPG67407.1 histidinol-phosphate transaminase [Candidatus Hydrogenedentota bacterium]